MKKLFKLIIPVSVASCLWAGCSNMSSRVTETLSGTNTTTKITEVHARTFFDSKSELAKFKSGQTDKAQTIGIGALSQESSGSNAVSLVESVVGAAVSAAIKGTVKP